MRKIAVLVLLALPALPQERVDLGIVDRVKAEAFEHSKVMETLRNLTDVRGPRLTGSPGFEDAAPSAEAASDSGPSPQAPDITRTQRAYPAIPSVARASAWVGGS